MGGINHHKLSWFIIVLPTLLLLWIHRAMHCAAPGLSTVLSWREAARRAAQSGGAEMVAERLERRRLGRKLRSMELKPREQ